MRIKPLAVIGVCAVGLVAKASADTSNSSDGDQSGLVPIWKDTRGKNVAMVSVGLSAVDFLIADNRGIIWSVNYPSQGGAVTAIRPLAGSCEMYYATSDCSGPSYFPLALSSRSAIENSCSGDVRSVPDGLAAIQTIDVRSQGSPENCQPFPVGSLQVSPFSNAPPATRPTSLGTPPYHVEFARLQ